MRNILMLSVLISVIFSGQLFAEEVKQKPGDIKSISNHSDNYWQKYKISGNSGDMKSTDKGKVDKDNIDENSDEDTIKKAPFIRQPEDEWSGEEENEETINDNLSGINPMDESSGDYYEGEGTVEEGPSDIFPSDEWPDESEDDATINKNP